MSDTIILSPAQIDFIKRTFPGFEGLSLQGELAGRAASQRYFTRIKHVDATYILIEWDSHDEDWQRFLAIGRDRLTTANLLPEIFADDPHHGLILEEDLGTVTLKQHCHTTAYDRQSMRAAYKKTIDALKLWQSPDVAANHVIASRSMDVDTFAWETSYFSRYCVTDYCGCEAMLTPSWEADRMRLANECASLAKTAIHRDFQSENILIHNDRIRFVDFQGARLGPPEYDLASLLYDPYIVQIDDVLRREIYEHYGTVNDTATTFSRPFYLCAAQRLMQALGAYGNLTLHKGKEWYQEYIPIALERLGGVMEHLDDFSHIRAVVRKCVEVNDEMESMLGDTTLIV
jgi:N-acetylmuramate 1-kinase